MGSKYYLFPESDDATAGSWTVSSGAVLWAMLDDAQNGTPSPDDDGTYAQGSPVGIGAGNPGYARFQMTAMIDAFQVNSITASYRINNAGGGAGQSARPYVRIGGTDYFGASNSPGGTYTTYTHTWTTNPATGLAWTQGDLSALVAGLEIQDSGGPVDSVRWTMFDVEVDHIPVPVQVGAAREMGTRYLLDQMNPRDQLEIDADISLYDDELMALIDVSHFQAPYSDGGGWGYSTDERRLHEIQAIRLDLETLVPTLTLLDVRKRMLSFYDTGIPTIATSADAQGVLRLDPGCQRTFNRDSNAWVQDIDLVVRRIGINQELLATTGILIENFKENGWTRSSFKSGLTGWTLFQGGTSGTIATDSTDLLFDPNESGNSCKLTAASPQTANLVAESPNSISYTANTKVIVSADYKEGASNTDLQWRLRRNFDNFYWRESDGTWQAAITNNPFTESLTRARMISRTIDVGANATTLTFAYALLLGGASGRVGWGYHVQVEPETWATTRIVTDASTVSRALASLSVSNNTGVRCWPRDEGTAYFEFVSEWNGSAQTGFPQFFYVSYDANNRFQLFFNGPAGNRLDWIVLVGGVQYTATATYNPTAFSNTKSRIAVRWIGANGAHGLAPYTLSIFVDGVKGTDAVASAMPTEAASSNLLIGGNNIDWSANGAMSQITVFYQALSDTEIARLPL